MKRTFLISLALLLGAGTAARGADIKEREPGPKSRGSIYEWKAKDGLVYRYYVPKKYDGKKGAGLTLILHGSNLDHRWGFANHRAGDFRPDDVVVCPDGTTPNGRGGFNFMGEKKDAARVHALIEELKEAFKINGVYIYGHSQGSFFAFYYAGEYPKDVNGVVGHASGVWNWTRQGRKGHHQAIVLMHGTQDPVVPYGQSVGGYESFVKAGYPMVRLRSLEGWNHWPAEHNGPVRHTSQQLAWVEGMTTEDPDRVEACFDLLCDNKSKERHDYAGLYTLAKRIVEMEDAPTKLVTRAKKAMAAVEELAENHVKEMKLPKKIDDLVKEPWVGHLPVFLRAFMDVPAREELAEEIGKTLSKQEKAVDKEFRVYWQKRKSDPVDAFAAGVAAVRDAFLHYAPANREFLDQLDTWRKELTLPKQAIRAYEESVPLYRELLEEGYREFDKVNRKARL